MKGGCKDRGFRNLRWFARLVLFVRIYVCVPGGRPGCLKVLLTIASNAHELASRAADNARFDLEVSLEEVANAEKIIRRCEVEQRRGRGSFFARVSLRRRVYTYGVAVVTAASISVVIEACVARVCVLEIGSSFDGGPCCFMCVCVLGWSWRNDGRVTSATLLRRLKRRYFVYDRTLVIDESSCSRHSPLLNQENCVSLKAIFGDTITGVCIKTRPAPKLPSRGNGSSDDVTKLTLRCIGASLIADCAHRFLRSDPLRWLRVW